MELRHLKYFLAVAEELNFTKAAEKLFISQPPLSRQIKELEDEVGAKLFTRNNKRVNLTDAGIYFQKETEQLLVRLESVVLKTRKISENKSGVFKIGYISSTFSKTISDLVSHLTQLYPYLTIQLFEVSTVKQIAALEQGKIDLGLLRAPVISTKIETKLWYRDPYCFVFNRNFVEIYSPDKLYSLKDQTFVFYNKDYAPRYYDSLLEICSRFGFMPGVIHESNNVNSIIQLVNSGLGVSILPLSVSKNYTSTELEFLSLKKTGFYTEVMFAFPKGDYNEVTDKAIAFLME